MNEINITVCEVMPSNSDRRVFAGEAGAEMRGDAGRAQGLQRAAAGRRGDDEMGDVRGASHHAVGALRLKIVDQ